MSEAGHLEAPVAWMGRQTYPVGEAGGSHLRQASASLMVAPSMKAPHSHGPSGGKGGGAGEAGGKGGGRGCSDDID